VLAAIVIKRVLIGTHEALTAPAWDQRIPA
jgi:hypothetical protein